MDKSLSLELDGRTRATGNGLSSITRFNQGRGIKAMRLRPLGRLPFFEIDVFALGQCHGLITSSVLIHQFYRALGKVFAWVSVSCSPPVFSFKCVSL
jgi:hypothetical protein